MSTALDLGATLASFASSSLTTSAPIASAASASSDSFSTDAPNRTLLVLKPALLPHPEEPSILGLQEAFDPFGGSSNVNSTVTITVFRDGCWLPGVDSSANCSQACTEPDLMFSNTSTLHNCVVYPAIAQYLLAVGQNGTVGSRVASLVLELMNLGYRNETLDPGPAIDECFYDYCTGHASKCKDYFKPVSQNSSWTISSTCGESELQNTSCFFDICINIDSPANPDIGGQWAYAAYWIQIALALLGYLLLTLYSPGLYLIAVAILSKHQGLRQGSVQAQKIWEEREKKLSSRHDSETSRTESKFRLSNLPAYLIAKSEDHHDRLVKALIDFQKAQCFFMLAIQIAAQVVQRKGGLQPNNLQQLYNTFVVIRSVSISGYLPVTFTLYALYSAGKTSWFLTILSGITITLSAVTKFSLSSFSPSQGDLEHLKNIPGPTTCGNLDPSVYCLRAISTGGIYGFDMATGSWGASEIFAFCTLIFVLLILYQLWISEYQLLLKPRIWLMKIGPIERATTYTTAKIAAPRLQEVWQRLGLSSWEALTKLVNLAILAVYISCFVIFMENLRILNSPEFGMIDTSSWSFGQIVAITVWAGPIVEYIHLEMRGIHRGFDHLLTRRWKVVRRQPDQTLLSDDRIEMPERTQADLSRQSTAYEPLQNPVTVGIEELGTSSLLYSEQPRDFL